MKHSAFPQSDKTDTLPRGYAGAKLARKARLAQAGVPHPRGLRANFVPSRKK